MQALGGWREVGVALGEKPRTIRAWYERGIPYRHYQAFIDLARREHIPGVTYQWLETMNEKLREEKRLRRKEPGQHGDRRLSRSTRTELIDGVPTEVPILPRPVVEFLSDGTILINGKNPGQGAELDMSEKLSLRRARLKQIQQAAA